MKACHRNSSGRGSAYALENIAITGSETSVCNDYLWWINFFGCDIVDI